MLGVVQGFLHTIHALWGRTMETGKATMQVIPINSRIIVTESVLPVAFCVAALAEDGILCKIDQAASFQNELHPVLRKTRCNLNGIYTYTSQLTISWTSSIHSSES